MGAERLLVAVAVVAAPGMERAGAAEQRRSQLQDCRAAKERLKHLSAKPFLKDRTNDLNPPLKSVSKLKHVDRNRKDVLRNVTKSAQGGGKLSAKSTQHTGHAGQQKPSNTFQRAVGVHPVQPGKSTKLPASAQTRGRLPAPGSGHLNPERKQKSTQETVTTAALHVGSDHSSPGAPCSLNEELQDGLVCHKENLSPRASTLPELNRDSQFDGSSLGKKRVLAYGQSSAKMSRPAVGPEDKIKNHQDKKNPVPDKFRKILPGSKSMSQKTSVRTQPLQPPRFLPASAHLLRKTPGTNQEKTTAVKQPVGKPPDRAPVGGFKHQFRPPVRSSPTKPLASGRPQGTTNLKSNLNRGGTVPWPRPVIKGGTDRKDMNVVCPRHTAASRGTGHPNQPPSTHCSKSQALKSDLRSRKDQLKPEPLKAIVQAGRVPRIPSAADRKKQLEEWLALKGKTYKRPPMMLLQKQAVKPPCRKVEAKEKQENPEQHCLVKINNILTECLKFVEKGVRAEELSKVLSVVPQAEKFAKFWICQAKLQARSGPFDVMGLYRAAVCAGAQPLQELREVVLDILKAAGRTSEGEKAEQPIPLEPTTPCPGERQPVASTPGPVGRPLTSLPLSVKLQVTSASRGREFPEGPELKFLTPVRRSLRVERAGSHYPEMLKDHDPVVSSLSEILDAEEETQFFFRKNKALPEVTGLEGVSSYSPESCQGVPGGASPPAPCAASHTTPLAALAAPRL